MIFAQKNIEEFLYTPGRFFEIPEFQRPYSWQANNIGEFLIDLEECANLEKSHYFGTVVFVRETDNIDSSSIIDGQQRVTTSLLMIMAIYHQVEANPSLSNISAETIKEKYLINRNAPQGQENRVKLRTVTTDNTVFQSIFDVNGDSDKLTQEEKQSKIYLAYAEFRDYFTTKKDLDRYITSLSRFEIVTIALDSRDDNPQRVFESINSTGKPLTDGDKIRNFALMLNKKIDRKYVYEKYWKIIEQTLTDSNKDYITDFFRSYVISKRQAIIRIDAVYPEFKKLFNKKIGDDQHIEDIDAYYGDISQMLEYYTVCKFGIDKKNRFKDINNTIFKMRYIQTDLYIPFAMSVMHYYDSGSINLEQLKRVFDLVEVYFSRRIVCNIPTTSTDRFLASLHKDTTEYLNNFPEEDYANIMAYTFLNRTGITRMPSDDELASSVISNPTYTQRTSHVNYILVSVDDISKESILLKQIANHELKLSIEHIMPQTISTAWREELGANAESIHEKYLHSLANLTLTGYNSEYSNRSFMDKKTMPNGFNESPLKINKMIARAEKWDEKELNKRQKWWISNLKTAWPIPSTTFNPPKSDTIISLIEDNELKGVGIRTLYIFDDIVPVSNWVQAMDSIAEHLYDYDTDFYSKIMNDEYLCRYIRTDGTTFNIATEIYDTGIFIETGIDNNTKMRIIHALADLFMLSNGDIRAELPPIVQKK